MALVGFYPPLKRFLLLFIGEAESSHLMVDGSDAGKGQDWDMRCGDYIQVPYVSDGGPLA